VLEQWGQTIVYLGMWVSGGTNIRLSMKGGTCIAGFAVHLVAVAATQSSEKRDLRQEPLCHHVPSLMFIGSADGFECEGDGKNKPPLWIKAKDWGAFRALTRQQSLQNSCPPGRPVRAGAARVGALFLDCPTKTPSLAIAACSASNAGSGVM
jgi:hypothetical protein